MIRPVEPQDLSSLAEILTQSFHPAEGWMAWTHPLLKLGIYEDLRTRLGSKSPHYLCLVAIHGLDDVSGTVEMSLRSCSWTIQNTHYPYISNLAVGENYRRQGIASKLLVSCEQVALRWGFRDLYLHVLENNQQARRLYFECGYRLCRVESSYINLLLNRPRRLLMHKRITQT